VENSGGNPMVNNLANKIDHIKNDSSILINEIPLKWSSIPLSEIISFGKRLEARVFDINIKNAIALLENSKYEKVNLYGENGFIINAYYGARLKRNYIKSSEESAIGFIGSSEMLDIYPKPVKFIKNSKKHSSLKVKHGTVLLSRSGTIGNITWVNNTLEKFLISEHAIRLECRENSGYVYAFLKSKIGRTIVESKIYGAVIQQIEPEHLSQILIPNPPNKSGLKAKIHNLIVNSFRLRDESNEIIDKATKLMIDELKLPAIDEFEFQTHGKNYNIQSYNKQLSTLYNRLDASYYNPVISKIIDHLIKHADEVTTIADSRISKDIILPGRFKRIYVKEGIGQIFIGGKQLYELDPTNKKYLSFVHHGDRIKNQLELFENMTLITCSGTIGKVILVPKHWENWTANQHIIRIVPQNNDIAGYLSIFLASDYGYQLIKRFSYGAVIDEINDNHVSQISIPILKNKDIQKEINKLALRANEIRYRAYELEQMALKIMDEEVIFAK
jgi:type I restriction enzyme S subunit